MNRKILFAFFMFLGSIVSTEAQRTEVTISLTEQFFDTLVDSIYQNSPAPEFQLSENHPPQQAGAPFNSFGPRSAVCTDTITLLRQNKSVKTAVRFREGKIYAPVAFSGNYSPPLIGCVDFSGWAESNVDLVFDANAQKLFGRIRVLNVNLDGTAGVGGSLIARMVQGSIDKKLNPIQIIDLEKLSFPFTLPNNAKLRMRAIGVRHQVVPGALNIIILYEFARE